MGNLGTKVEIDRIRTKLKKLSWLGQSGYLEYDLYISNFLHNKKLDFLYQCMDLHFDINVSDYPSFDQFKRNAWERILETSKLPFLESLTNLYKKKGVYQIGNEIRDAVGGVYTFELSETLDTSLNVLATQSKIGIGQQNGKIVVTVNDPKIYSIDISGVTWATYSKQPTEPFEIDLIKAESYYDIISYTGSTTNSAINENSISVNTTFVTSSEISIDRIDLSISVTHSFLGDLQINLSAPNGRVINAKRQGGLLDSGRSMNVKFTTENSLPRLMRTNKNDMTGTYRMDKFGGIGQGPFISNATEAKQLLTAGSASGTWSLAVIDVGVGNTGTLRSWSVDFMGLRFNEHLQMPSYETKIPSYTGGTYRLKVTTKSPYGEFLYRAQIDKDDLLGTIREIDATELVDGVFYLRSRKVAQVTGNARIFLEVTKKSTGEVQTFASYDPELSEEGNLFERYTQAINFLVS